jgi:peptide/nickel transport system substrate-binding protein
MSVAVTTVPVPVPLAVGRYFVSLLRQLGYKASLRVVENFQPFVADSRNRVQFGNASWFADKLIPSNFLDPILTCAAFVPKSPTNGNWFEYCNPEIDAKIKEAALLQTSDPVRANALWGEIDKTLVDQAVALPWIAPRTRILVSARVGNYRNHPLWGPLLDQIWVK